MTIPIIDLELPALAGPYSLQCHRSVAGVWMIAGDRRLLSVLPAEPEALGRVEEAMGERDGRGVARTATLTQRTTRRRVADLGGRRGATLNRRSTAGSAP